MALKITLIPSALSGAARFIANLLKSQGSTKIKRKNSSGAEGEKRAADFLKRIGFKILQKNYSCYSGEIDIIAKDAGTIVFVEVKTRSEGGNELPEAALTGKKRHRICKAAQHFMRKYKLEEPLFRFDLIAVEFNREGEWKINHLKNVIDYRKGLARRY